VRRVADETREAMARVAAELEEDGYEVNRRALAREFGVSPQTVARVLEGPLARRGLDPEMTHDGSWQRRIVVGIALAIGVGWWFREATRG
jgi:hypothetical protein